MLSALICPAAPLIVAIASTREKTMQTFTKYQPVRKKVTTGKLNRSKAMPEWIGVPANWRDRLGFVYVIVFKETGKFYIGKKLFWKSAKRMKSKVREESNWREYCGSSKQVEQELKSGQAYERHMLQCFNSKSELNLCELMYQLRHITDDNCLNGIINVRLYIRPEMKSVRMDRRIEEIIANDKSPCRTCGKPTKYQYCSDGCTPDCPHGSKPDECDECAHLSDLAYDAARESR